MDVTSAVLAGALAGLAGCVPLAVPFEGALRAGAKVSIAAGMAGVMASFLMMTVALAAAYAVAGAGRPFLAFACSMVALFLLFWAVEAIRAWRAANGRRRA